MKMRYLKLRQRLLSTILTIPAILIIKGIGDPLAGLLAELIAELLAGLLAGLLADAPALQMSALA